MLVETEYPETPGPVAAAVLVVRMELARLVVRRQRWAHVGPAAAAMVVAQLEALGEDQQAVPAVTIA